MATERKANWLPPSKLREDLAKASQRAEASLSLAKLLMVQGFPGPALVWAVRSVEIFFKDFILTGVFLIEDPETDWDRATRKARNLFEELQWKKAIRKIQDEFGPLDPMVTQDGHDVLEVWEKEIVPARHNIVHGREDSQPEFAEEVLLWAELITKQLKMRLIAAGKHPFSHEFKTLLKAAQDAYHGRSADT